VPAEQAFVCQWILIFLGSVEHQLDDAFDMSVGCRQCSDVEPQAACEGGAYPLDVEDLPLDLARLILFSAHQAEKNRDILRKRRR